MEKRSDQQTRTESKPRLVEQINSYLHSGDYSRALDLSRSTAAEFPNDEELSELEKLARDGVKRHAEAQRLITESQELFAQQKSTEAIQLLREAYELDKNNSLARAILANALVEHAHSVVETDWLEAETLTNQALKLNPAHPTAKTIRSLIVEQKKPAPWRIGLSERASSSPPAIYLQRWLGLLRDWRFIPTIPSCFRFTRPSSATRPLGGARLAAATWKTCGAWSAKSMPPRTRQQNKR